MIDAPITPIPGIEPAAGTAGRRPVVLLGGTFDPPHRGHIGQARAACAARRRHFGGAGALLLFVPAARSPHKADGPIASGPDRVDMLRAAIADEASGGDADAGVIMDVWTDELDRAEADPQGGAGSYTVDTLRRARRWLDAHAPGSPLLMMIGQDQALALHRWREPEAILSLAGLIVLPRDEAGAVPMSFADRHSALLAQLHQPGTGWTDEQAAFLAGSLVDVPPLLAASTALRRAIGTVNARHRGAPPQGIYPGVWKLIGDRGLYDFGG